MFFGKQGCLTGISLVFVAGICTQARAQSYDSKVTVRVEKPKSMGALGDSMAAGLLARFNRATSGLPWNASLFLGSLAGYLVTDEMRVLEAPELSWSTGLDLRKRVKSHAIRLGFDFRHRNKVINAAVSGAESIDLLEKQMFDLNFESQRKLRQEFPDYVTFQIGPNDACSTAVEKMRSVTDYYSNIYAALDYILFTSEKTRIMVPHIPNIESLRAVAKDAPVFAFKEQGITKCEQLWKIAKICPTLTTINHPQERQIVAQRVIDYNNALSDAVEKLSRRYGDRIRVSKRTYDVNFTADYLSVDCFHPNPLGQNVLSQETFKDSWWANQK
jgi:lysophospholipase L1-like esterase